MLGHLTGELEKRRSYRAVRAVVRSLDEHGAMRAASAMAFDAFLSLIPLIAFAGYVLSRIHQSSALLLGPIIRAAPPDVARAVEAEFARMSQSSAVAPIGVIGFLWVSSAGVSTAMGVFETMYGATERPWYVRRAIAAGCVLLSLGVIPVVAGLGVLIGALSGSTGAWLVAVTLPGALLVLFVAGFFRIAIRQRHVERRRIVPGALVTVLLWALVSAAFSLYVATLARYATFYGSLATTAIFLFWLWLLALALMVGGEVNARLERERRGLTSLSPGGIVALAASSAIPKAPALPAEARDAAEPAFEEREKPKKPARRGDSDTTLRSEGAVSESAEAVLRARAAAAAEEAGEAGEGAMRDSKKGAATD